MAVLVTAIHASPQTPLRMLLLLFVGRPAHPRRHGRACHGHPRLAADTPADAGFAWGYLYLAVSWDQCVAGASAPWKAALGLSIRKALPFAGIASSEKLNQIYACLYGIHGQTSTTVDLPAGFTPVIPDAVDYLGMLQLVLSILLLFLFLLAVRNHFRIR